MELLPLGRAHVKGTRGRPKRYRETLGREIGDAIDAGYSAEDILTGLGTSWKELKGFAKANKDEGLRSSLKRLGALTTKRENLSLSAIEEETTYEGQLAHGSVEAVRALRKVLRDSQNDGAKVRAAQEILDRTKGKAVQTTHVNQNVSYTIQSSIPVAPNAANRDVIGEGDVTEARGVIEASKLGSGVWGGYGGGGVDDSD